MEDAIGSKVWTVYRYYDAEDRLLYVGMTGQGPFRAHGHNRSAPWWVLVGRGEFEHFATAGQAFTEELRLIRELAPPFNRADNPKAPHRTPRKPTPRKPAVHPKITPRRQGGATKRRAIEQYLASLTDDQLAAATETSVQVAVLAQGTQITSRYAAAVLSEWRLDGGYKRAEKSKRKLIEEALDRLGLNEAREAGVPTQVVAELAKHGVVVTPRYVSSVRHLIA